MDRSNDFTASCPISIQQYRQALLAHGGGGKLTHQLIERMFVPSFNNSLLGARHDGAVIDLHTLNGSRLAFTTDSYVVRPLFFPGGDIGALAVNGTVNDLAMCGARPLYLSAGFILEEGLPIRRRRFNNRRGGERRIRSRDIEEPHWRYQDRRYVHRRATAANLLKPVHSSIVLRIQVGFCRD